ncbi:MAG: alpha/beta hydrolase [Ruminococcaceae bacterium]|nr:alpha/beta hydrolase [Oscillospiraceae bacterium]
MWLLWSAVVAVVLFLAVGGYTFQTACKRAVEPNWLNEEALEKTGYAKYKEHIRAANHWLETHTTVDVWTESHDGLKLHAIWVPADDPKGTVLLAHGYRSCKLADFGMVYELYHNLGLNLLLIDQRSHGRSEGRYITFGVLESRDLQKWVQFHNEQFGHHPVILSGLSMGASTVLYLADRRLPKNVKGIVADCGFTSPKEIIAKVFRDTVHFGAGPFLWAADLFARVLAGFSLYERDTRKSLAKSRLPVLLIHGKGDDFVPCYMTEQAYKACTSPKEMYLVEEAGHGISYLYDTPGYRKRVMDFLRKYMNKDI